MPPSFLADLFLDRIIRMSHLKVSKSYKIRDGFIHPSRLSGMGRQTSKQCVELHRVVCVNKPALLEPHDLAWV